jgi:hypothetical protein
MTAAELRNAIDTDLYHGDTSRLAEYETYWESLRPHTHPAYWPVIDDRLNALSNL